MEARGNKFGDRSKNSSKQKNITQTNLIFQASGTIFSFGFWDSMVFFIMVFFMPQDLIYV